MTITLDLNQELQNLSLQVKGKIPPWLFGTLIRNGPINVTIEGQTNVHWFDGLAMLHAFSFAHGNVKYSNKFLRTDAYKEVFEKKSLRYTGFAVDPCRSLFKRFFTFFFQKSEKELHNANINVAKVADQYVALTEVPLPIKFDPQTLETLGVLDYQDHLPHSKCWESAHPHVDPETGDIFNYLIQYGKQSYYLFYRIEKGTSKRTIISQIPVQEPSYMHSFALTRNYLILTEFPLVVKPLDFLTKNLPFIKNFSWQPERGTQFLVVNRHTGKVVGKYKTEAFFAFHHANAFEQDETLILDLIRYPNSRIICDVAHYFREDQNLSIESLHPSLSRFSLSLKSGEISHKTLFDQPVEFPRLNPHYDGKKYQFLYLVDPEDARATCPIYKFNPSNQAVLKWEEKDCFPGEPVFVPKPQSNEEDEGVVLAVVLNRKQKNSFLLVLDAKDFNELGRAEVTHAIPIGLHGQYFDVSSKKDIQ